MDLHGQGVGQNQRVQVEEADHAGHPQVGGVDPQEGVQGRQEVRTDRGARGWHLEEQLVQLGQAPRVRQAQVREVDYHLAGRKEEQEKQQEKEQEQERVLLCLGGA